jgi:hypothetical protein
MIADLGLDGGGGGAPTAGQGQASAGRKGTGWFIVQRIGG